MAQLLTSTQLYPPNATREFLDYLRSLTNGDRDESGNFLLRHALHDGDRRALQERAKELAPWLVPQTKKGDYVDPIKRMLLTGGGAAVTEKEAAVIVAEFVSYVYRMPLWAVERACRMFGNGEVTADMLDDPKFDKGMRPSSAQFAYICREVMRPFAEESTRISMTIRGTVGREPDEAERARVGEKLSNFAEALTLQSDLRRDEERTAAVQRLSASDQFNRSMILREYEAKGLAPRFGKDGKPQSLSLLLSVGWTIEEGGEGRRYLVPPPAPPPGDPRDPANRFSNLEGS